MSSTAAPNRALLADCDNPTHLLAPGNALIGQPQ